MNDNRHTILGFGCMPGTETIRAVAVCILCVTVLSGCRLFEEGEAPPQPRPPAPAPTPVPDEPAGDMDTAMELLQDGRFEDARKLLERLARVDTGTPGASALLRQLKQPARRILPGPYREITVQPGESLSLIAERELGDPLLFVALARLNGIEKPGLVAAGRSLRVPVPETPEADTPQGSDEPAAASPEELRTVADYLVLSGQPEQARQLLIGALAEDDEASSLAGPLAELTVTQVQSWREQAMFDRALAALDEALGVVRDPLVAERLVGMRRETEAARLRSRARALLREGQLEQAYVKAGEALELTPQSEASRQLHARLKEQFTTTLHERALVAWRDRDVDLAIRSWETLLEKVPDFEPARVYLERARRLRARLD